MRVTKNFPEAETADETRQPVAASRGRGCNRRFVSSPFSSAAPKEFTRRTDHDLHHLDHLFPLHDGDLPGRADIFLICTSMICMI